MAHGMRDSYTYLDREKEFNKKKRVKKEVEEKSCFTCKFHTDIGCEKDCVECGSYRLWEPKIEKEEVKKEVEEKSCKNCNHKKNYQERPCLKCVEFIYWEPKIEKSCDNCGNYFDGVRCESKDLIECWRKKTWRSWEPKEITKEKDCYNCGNNSSNNIDVYCEVPDGIECHDKKTWRSWKPMKKEIKKSCYGCKHAVRDINNVLLKCLAGDFLKCSVETWRSWEPKKVLPKCYQKEHLGRSKCIANKEGYCNGKNPECFALKKPKIIEKEEVKKEMEKICNNCKYEKTKIIEQPCLNCTHFKFWEPKEITKEKDCYNCGNFNDSSFCLAHDGIDCHEKKTWRSWKPKAEKYLWEKLLEEKELKKRREKYEEQKKEYLNQIIKINENYDTIDATECGQKEIKIKLKEKQKCYRKEHLDYVNDETKCGHDLDGNCSNLGIACNFRQPPTRQQQLNELKERINKNKEKAEVQILAEKLRKKQQRILEEQKKQIELENEHFNKRLIQISDNFEMNLEKEKKEEVKNKMEPVEKMKEKIEEKKKEREEYLNKIRKIIIKDEKKLTKKKSDDGYYFKKEFLKFLDKKIFSNKPISKDAKNIIKGFNYAPNGFYIGKHNLLKTKEFLKLKNWMGIKIMLEMIKDAIPLYLNNIYEEELKSITECYRDISGENPCTQICESCGVENMLKANFCNNCGGDLK